MEKNNINNNGNNNIPSEFPIFSEFKPENNIGYKNVPLFDCEYIQNTCHNTLNVYQIENNGDIILSNSIVNDSNNNINTENYLSTNMALQKINDSDLEKKAITGTINKIKFDDSMLFLESLVIKYIERNKNFRIFLHCYSLMQKKLSLISNKVFIGDNSDLFLEGELGIIKDGNYIKLDKCCNNCKTPLININYCTDNFSQNGKAHFVVKINFTKSHSGLVGSVIGMRFVIKKSDSSNDLSHDLEKNIIISNWIALPIKRNMVKPKNLNSKK